MGRARRETVERCGFVSQAMRDVNAGNQRRSSQASRRSAAKSCSEDHGLQCRTAGGVALLDAAGARRR